MQLQSFAFILPAVVILGVLFVSGCSSDSTQAPETGGQSADKPKGSSDTSQSSGSSDTSNNGGKVKEIEMTARQFAFEPSQITVNKGDTVRLKVTSTDVAHGIAIPAFGVNQQLPAGETKTVEFTANKKGTFDFACSVYCGSGHNSMTGTVVVK